MNDIGATADGVALIQQGHSEEQERALRRRLAIEAIEHELPVFSLFVEECGGEVALCCDENYVRARMRQCIARAGHIAYYGAWQLTFNEMTGKFIERRAVRPVSAMTSGAGGSGSHDLAFGLNSGLVTSEIHLELKTVSATGGKQGEGLGKGLAKDLDRLRSDEAVRMFDLVDSGCAHAGSPWPLNLVAELGGMFSWADETATCEAVANWSVHVVSMPETAETVDVLIAWRQCTVNQGVGSEGPARRAAIFVRPI